MSVIVTIVIVLLAALWGMTVYSRLARLRHSVQRHWRQVDVQLKRRHDLIPTLIEAVDGAMPFEPGALEAVANARQRAMAATRPKAAAERESALSASVDRLITMVVERGPDPTVNRPVRSLQGDLAAMTAAIASARTRYNDAAAAYNTAIGVPPAVLVARLARFTRAELFTDTKAGSGAARAGLE